MTTALDRKSAYDGVMERAETIAEASAGGPVAKVSVSQWVQSGREPGRRLTDPRMFAVYYQLPEDDRDTPARMAAVSLQLTDEELRALNS